MGTLIEIRDLSKVYERGKQKVEVLHHINLNIAEGDFLALMGPSGSGKTTLLNLIGGLDTPTSGKHYGGRSAHRSIGRGCAGTLAGIERGLRVPVLQPDADAAARRRMWSCRCC